MGVYDREYYRDENPRGINLGDQWSMTTKLIVINIAVYVLDLFIGGPDNKVMNWLAAGPESIAKPYYCWQLLTYGFAHDRAGIGHIFWNMFALWIFGRDVESVYGPKEFLRIYLVTIVLGGLAFSVRSMAMVDPSMWDRVHVVGASGAVTAVTLLFCFHYPKRTILLFLVLPVPAWALGLIVIVGNLIGVLSPGASNTAFDVHLVGAAFAICYYRFGWRLSSWIPSIRSPKNLLKKKPKLKVHNPDDSYRDLDQEGDMLLDKVKRKGIESLTSAEKSKLEAYSRRMQQKHR